MNIKEDFNMLKNGLIYFDNGATTLKPNCVVDAIKDYYLNYSANAHRGDYAISLKVDMAYEGVREKVKEFINAKSESEIIFTSGATQSLNMIANGFFNKFLEEDDEILITTSEHASNVLPWFNLANKLKCKIKYIKLDENHRVTLENVKNAITDKTKVISLAEITNVVGDIRPIKEISKYAHEKNIFVVVDGAQSVPHKKCDVQDLDCDFLAFSAHKMCGPTGVGVLYGKEKLLEEMDPVNLGGGMNESFDDENHIYLKELPTRLEAGTPNIAGVIGLGSAIEYLNKIGMDNIRKKEIKLKEYLINKLSNNNFINIVNKDSDSGIVALNIDGIFPQDVAVYLDKYNICVRAGNHCAKILKKEIGIKNTVRISMYFYNTYEEIDKLVDLLKDKDKIMKEMI
jgi:cysteine desulfurase/selenocysteine lyase